MMTGLDWTMIISKQFQRGIMSVIRFKSIGLAILAITLLVSCVKPNDPYQNNVDVLLTQVDQVNTIGYARDIFIADTMMFVAASQAGGQIWTQRAGEWGMRYQNIFNTVELELIQYDMVNHILLAADKRSGYLLPMDSTNLAPDSTYSLQQFSDSNTQDFAFVAKPDTIQLWLADLDGSDGLKFFIFKRGVDPFGLPSWEINTGEKIKVASYTGLDKRDNQLGVARSELGIELFNLPVQAGSLPVMSADTPGEALDVTFYKNELLVADNWAGMTTFQIGDSTLTQTDQLSLNGWVKHIDLWNDYAFLSCAGNGLFVVKLGQNGAASTVDQYLPISYVYDVTIAGDYLYVASREGVLIYKIEMNSNG